MRFDERVWQAVSLIPPRHVATYGQVADWIDAWGLLVRWDGLCAG